MTEPVKGHNHDTAADLEADELRAESQRWRERLGRAEERALQFEKERDEAQRQLEAARRALDCPGAPITDCMCAHCIDYRKALEGRVAAQSLAEHYREERDAALRGRDRLHDEAANHYGLRIRAERERDAATHRAEAAEARFAELEQDCLKVVCHSCEDTRARAEAAESTTRGAALELSRVSRELGLTLARAEEAEAQADMLSKQCAEQEHELVARFARAESAEARVKELEDHPPGIGDADIQRVFRERDAAEAALRVAREAMERAERVQTSHLVNGMPGWPPYRVNRDAGEILAEVRNILRAAIAPKEGT